MIKVGQIGTLKFRNGYRQFDTIVNQITVVVTKIYQKGEPHIDQDKILVEELLEGNYQTRDNLFFLPADGSDKAFMGSEDKPFSLNDIEWWDDRDILVHYATQFAYKGITPDYGWANYNEEDMDKFEKLFFEYIKNENP